MTKVRCLSVAIALVMVALCSVDASAQGPVRRLLNARPGVLIPKVQVQYQSASRNVSHQGLYASASVGSVSSSVSLADVGVGTAAYAHCKAEAAAQAARRRVAHLMGIAPGARMQGVGSSFSPNAPNHCTGVGLVARAGVRGDDGRWYWSAAYLR